uniref:Neurotransmitter-gated ion-channel ligand-binding domain-containing protein n=1 Tax=Plectus sambesii TaxID=2011161 RepID=A0A914V3I7_9BILA
MKSIIVLCVGLAYWPTNYAAQTPGPETDHPIIIERPHSPVELGDLLLEYNRYIGPSIDGQVTVALSLHLLHVAWSNQVMTATFFLRQSWTDSRLVFTGDHDVEVPTRDEIWEPDTFFPSAIETKTSAAATERSLRLAPNGTATRSARISVVVPCQLTAAAIIAHDGRVNCTIDIGSYGNSGVSQIKYQWRRDMSINYGGLERIVKSAANTTSLVRVATGEYSKASALIELQTALTRQVLDYIVLKKSDL